MTIHIYASALRASQWGESKTEGLSVSEMLNVWFVTFFTYCIHPHHCGPHSRCPRHIATGPGCRYTRQTHWLHMWSGFSHTNTPRYTELLYTQRKSG